MKKTCFSSDKICLKSVFILLAMIFALCIFSNPANAGDYSVFEKQGQDGEIILAKAYKSKELNRQSGSKVPNLPCNASYTRGSNSNGAYINVTALDAKCKYFEGIYYWNSSLQFYCKNPSNCSNNYLRNIPAP